MAREATITLAQVAAAAAELKARGVKPTIRAVREALGGIGSLTTISRMLQGWLDEQPAQAVPSVALPPAVAAAITLAISQERATAQADVLAELAEMRQTLDAITGEAERTTEALEKAESDVRKLEGVRAELTARLDEEKQAHAAAGEEARKRIKELEDENARERAAAEGARTELAKAQLRLEALPRMQSDLDKSRDTNSELLGRVNMAERDLAAARAELAAVREAFEREREMARQAAVRADADLKSARQAQEKAEGRADAERTRREEMGAELATLRAKTATAEKEEVPAQPVSGNTE